MKLYTEEQIRQAWNIAYTDALSIDEPDYKPKFYDEFIQSLTPIELPTDEEIEKIATKLEHYEGAIWLKYKIIKQIQGGNK